MKEKIIKFFTTNIGFKVLSFVIAILVWALLSNMQDPTLTKTISVPVTYVNEDILMNNEDLILLSGPDSVNVTVTIRTSSSSKLSSNFFTCVADLSDHSGGDVHSSRVPIHVTQVGGDDVILNWSYYKNDPNITVNLDELISKTLPIGYLATTPLPEGWVFTEGPTFIPSEVTVYGPKARFNNVTSVKAPVSFEALLNPDSPEVFKEVTLNLYDGNDQLIDLGTAGLYLTENVVGMAFKVSRVGGATLTIDGTNYTGKPATDHEVTNVSLAPATVSLYGAAEKVTSLTEIHIPASDIDISGISGNKEIILDIQKYLPEGVYISGGNSKVTAKVTVVKMVSKNFTVTESDIRLKGTDSSYSYTITHFTETITVRGNESDIQRFSVSLLNPTVDVTNLRPGTHKLSVTLTPGSAYTIEKEGGLVEITISEREKTSSSEAE